MTIAFVVGPGRSGTTSLIKQLDLSAEAYCLSEPMPNLNIESRLKYEGALPNPYRVLHEAVGQRASEGLSKAPVYIEKQLSLVPFVSELYKLYRCKFIIPYRDGKEVVSSLINWHQMLWPIIYRESREKVNYSQHALRVIENIVEPEAFDYSLPRPIIGEEFHEEWKNFSRFQMVCWYWGKVYRTLFEQLKTVDPKDVIFVDYRNPNAGVIRQVYEFLGLTDFDARRSQNLLEKKVNSLKDRGSLTGEFPYPGEWSTKQHEQYYGFNADVEMRLALSQQESSAVDNGQTLENSKMQCSKLPPSDYKNYIVEDDFSISSSELLRQVESGKTSFLESNRDMVTNYEKIEALIKCSGNFASDLVGSSAFLNEGCKKIRVDVDVDIDAALDMAKAFSLLNIVAVFYICHTAFYYGRFSNGRFYRNGALIEILKEIQELGQEIGLHIDPYSFFQNYQVDGASAVQQELAWLRSHGLNIRCATGHNAAPYYGAESMEIFQEYALDSNCRFIHNSCVMPKGVLSAKELDIEFDGSMMVKPNPEVTLKQDYMSGSGSGCVIQNKLWMKRYLIDGGYCQWGWDYNFWLVGSDKWTASVPSDCDSAGRSYRYEMSTDEVSKIIAKIPKQSSLCITLHPLYIQTKNTIKDWDSDERWSAKLMPRLRRRLHCLVGKFSHD